MSPSPAGETDPGRDATSGETDPRIEARSRLGEHLSQARQSKEIGISEASDQLRIRKNYLEALESGDWDPLPEEVYVMGFLRQYAALLGVDLSQEIEALKTGEYTLTKPFTMPDPPIAMNRAWAIAAGACFLILLILFNVVDDGEEELHPMQRQAANPAVAPDSSTIMEQRAAGKPGSEPDALQTEMQPPADPTAAASGQTLKYASDVKKPAAESVVRESPENAATPVTIKSATTGEASRSTGPTAVMTQSDGNRHAFHLTAVDQDVWLQLYNPDGSLAKEALLRSGQSLRLNTDVDYLLLTSGNPLALSINIDGLPVTEPGTLGEKTKVLRDYRLQPPVAPSDSGD